MWSLRIALSRLRPLDASGIARLLIVAALLAAFLYGDFALFRRLFRAAAQIEATTPFFALGLLRNLLAMVFLVAIVVLFSSALTAAIGAFFSDLDLDILHSAPRSLWRIAVSRWAKTLFQSATVVFAFLAPLFVAFSKQYATPPSFFPVAGLNLALLLTIPVTLASTAILLLVRFFPVRRVHQIVALLATLVLTLAVIAFRMSRPERFFRDLDTDDVVRVLRAIELPAMDVYPSTWLAKLIVEHAGGGAPPLEPRIAVPAVVLFALFLVIARATYFPAFVRARESMAPVALGSAFATRLIDRLLRPFSLEAQAMIGKEVRTVARDVAQWSQVFLMGALLFIYLYNIRMLPLAGDARATIIAYANLGMAGFVVAAVCLRFAYPSVSAEGKAFWLLRAAPVSYRRFLLVKVVIYGVPLTAMAVLLTAVANAILDAGAVVWTFTLTGSVIISVTLVCLGVGMGGIAPRFDAENPLQVGLSLGGFAYMAVSMLYVAWVMFLMARPVMRYLFWRVFGADNAVATAAPIAIALATSALLAAVPLLVAERRLCDVS
ncbi:MAG TPA: hypothetical protein VNL91_02780 [Thermoanaerobaculia bacterium]|nr:hypothetical protein [Thermoanaerobaculia bacterium]